MKSQPNSVCVCVFLSRVSHEDAMNSGSGIYIPRLECIVWRNLVLDFLEAVWTASAWSKEKLKIFNLLWHWQKLDDTDNRCVIVGVDIQSERQMDDFLGKKHQFQKPIPLLNAANVVRLIDVVCFVWKDRWRSENTPNLLVFLRGPVQFNGVRSTFSIKIETQPQSHKNMELFSRHIFLFGTPHVLLTGHVGDFTKRCLLDF